MRKVVVTSAALEAANVLREEMLRDVKNDEWLLGSEDEVMQSLEVSWPTLRQALRLLEPAQLISVRRCRRRPLRPTGEGVIPPASVYMPAGGNFVGLIHRTTRTRPGR